MDEDKRQKHGGPQGSITSARRQALHLYVLCAFALAQPVYDILGRAPEFFVVRQAVAWEVFLLVGLLSFALPTLLLAMEYGLGLISQRLRAIFHLGVIAQLVAVIFLPMGSMLDAMPVVRDYNALFLATFVLGLGAVAGGTAAWWTTQARAPNLLLTVLAPAVLLFPWLFLFQPGVRAVWLGRTPVPALEVTVENPVPVVMVVFDEFNGASLFDGAGQVDGALFPSFAALSRDAHWFRNATTAHSQTTRAVPALLTGRYSLPGQLPWVDDHPGNLFTLLGKSHSLHVYETVTDLCPTGTRTALTSTVEEGDDEELTGWARVESLVSDVGIVYLHRIVPRGLTGVLPPIGARWGRFVAVNNQVRGNRRQDRDALFARFLESLKSSTDTARPGVHFVHVVLPHVPWEYLPSGKRYDFPSSLPWAIGNDFSRETWLNDAWAVTQAHQRYLLQVGFADNLIGQLTTRLKTLGIYDRCLLVVTADHGVSFRAGQSRRNLTGQAVADILPVPLFVKLPGQKQGEINDRNVESIDLLPTLANALGVQIPWDIHGQIALDNSIPERPCKEVRDVRGQSSVFPARFAGSTESAAQRRALFTQGNGWDAIYRIGPHPELIGRAIHSLPLLAHDKNKTFRSFLENAHLFSALDPSANALPCHVHGHLEPAPRAPVALAIALNGRIVATTYTYQLSDYQGHWTTMIPEAAFSSGPQRIEVFVLETTGRQTRLRATLDQQPRYKLETSNNGGVALVSGTGARHRVIPDRVHGWVDTLLPRPLFHELAGWAGDLRTSKPARRVVVFVNGTFVAAEDRLVPRVDMAQTLRMPRFRMVGYSIALPRALFHNQRDVRVFAIGEHGDASELLYAPSFVEWRRSKVTASPGESRRAPSATPAPAPAARAPVPLAN